MSKAHDSHACTCPTGDGSLSWPCPVHPALLPCPFCGACARGYETEPHQHSAALLALVSNMPKEHKGRYVIENYWQCGTDLMGDNQAEVKAWWKVNTNKLSSTQQVHTPGLIRQPICNFHYALNTWQHSVLVCSASLNANLAALKMHWTQGCEAAKCSLFR